MMTRSLCQIALVWLAATPLFTSPARAQHQPLTPQEVADGWILLFDGESLFGWAPRGDAQWTAADGAVVYQAGTGPGYLATTTEFADYQLRLEFWVDAVANSGVFLRGPTAGIITPTNAYEVNICDPHEKWPTGSINEIARAQAAVKSVGQWNSYEIAAQADHLTVRLNGRTTVDVHDARLARGVIALQQFKGDGQVRFRNVRLKPLGLESIFNGKDLTGWKVMPDHKSVYSVTPEGWLNVKNGNGDLQSDGRYADFVFQLEIIANGTHLNSGVFFRAIPGQFWAGYESQIRNEWEGEDRAKPVDYGTGAIYRRQPARRVVSSDREWFTKTIVAHGPHLATWVNGIQIADWTDTRPPHENPRQGYRAQAGAISLQGHDPTTDLSFRNLRIAEMPPGRRE